MVDSSIIYQVMIKLPQNNYDCFWGLQICGCYYDNAR